jgi:spore maturation protein CgeB
VRRTAQTLIAPVWSRHLDRIISAQPDIDALIFLTVPLNQLVGVAAEVTRKHNKPVFYYDGDVPASLPNMRGFATGFRMYQGANPAEFTAFFSNSAGAVDALRELGAREVHTIYYGIDPDVFSPVDVPDKDIDFMFYGHGREYRSEWVDAMISAPSKVLTDSRFAVRGTKLGDLGRAEMLPYLSFSKLRQYSCRAKINLCITRLAHASVYASSSSRPFELAGMKACIVANTYNGIEQWFEPDKEVFIVNSEEEAIDRYRFLLGHESARLAAGEAARERVLKEHTFRHRARQLARIIKSYL